jgi:hypothetical protein
MVLRGFVARAYCGSVMRKWARDFMLGTATNATRPAAVRSKVTNGRKMIADLDGRSVPARRWRDLVIGYADDFGGLANLTEVQRTLISQAATLAVEGEKLSVAVLKGKSADSEALTRLANATQRVLQQLGATRRQPRGQAQAELSAYLARTHEEPAT